jgi:hypothetical protein
MVFGALYQASSTSSTFATLRLASVENGSHVHITPLVSWRLTGIQHRRIDNLDCIVQRLQLLHALLAAASASALA